MDFYAMQLTPRKKDDEKEKREEQLKKIREHVVTKEELLEELKPKLNKQELTKEQTVKGPDFLSDKTFSLPIKNITENVKVEKAQEDKKSEEADVKEKKKEKEKVEIKRRISTKKMPKDIWNLSGKKDVNEEKKNTAIKESDEKIPIGIPSEEEIEKINDEFLRAHELKKNVNEAKTVLNVPAKEDEKDLVRTEDAPFEGNGQGELKTSEVTQLPKDKIIPVSNPVKPSQIESKTENNREAILPKASESVVDENKIVDDIAKALTAFDEAKISDAIARIVAYRSQDPSRAASEAEINMKLKKAIIATLPALFAYKGSKALVYVLELLDEFNLKFGYRDFENLPADVLQSGEFKNVCQKYLLWFAREYPEQPGQLQDRIYCFNKCGVIGYEEIKGFAGLQTAILSDLVNFIRQNVDDPHDVERKVFEFALAGFVNEKEVKQMPKVKDIMKKFVLSAISAKKEKPSDAAKKINEYEKMGFIAGGEILADEKIGKFIERYLLKYKKENQAHPRKVSALIKDYFDAGLIDKKMRDRLM